MIYLTTLPFGRIIKREVVEWMMNFKGFGRKHSWPNLRCYPDIHVEGLSNTTKSISHDVGYLNRSVEYKEEVRRVGPELTL
jgi:hypothetical protein